MPNSKQWSSATPGHIVLMLDQSGSMSNDYGTTGLTKAAFAAQTLNNLIYELIIANSSGQTVKNRVFITIIGYSDDAGEIQSGSLEDFYNNILRLETQNAGTPREIQRPVWIEPLSDGLTAMGNAFEIAKDKIEDWMTAHPDSPSPVVINISDGMPQPAGERHRARTAAVEIMQLDYDDGSPLVFNAHIGDGQQFLFPDSNNGLNAQTDFLFEISSIVPASYREAALKLNFTLGDDAKGLISNADGNTLVRFINFGSSMSR